MRMPTVLVVEDEEHLRATLAYNLRKAGYAVQTAAAGPEAIRMFQAHAPDLVLLDVMLPGFDGFEVCRRLRQSSSVPIKSLQGDRWALAHRGGIGARRMDGMQVDQRAANYDVLDTFSASYCLKPLFMVQLFCRLIPFGASSYGASLLDSSPALRVRSAPPRKQVRYRPTYQSLHGGERSPGAATRTWRLSLWWAVVW